MLLTVFVCATLPAAVMLAAHYVPWGRWLPAGLPVLGAYAIGTAGIAVPVTVAALFVEQPVSVAGLLWLAVASAGAATAAAHRWDAAHRREHELLNQIDQLVNDGD